MKIQKPFNYTGSKGRFYKEIKEIFIKSKKNTYIDLFAGGMEVAVNLKDEFIDIEVLVNVKDEHIKSLLKSKKTAIKTYLKMINYLYAGIDKINSTKIFNENKKIWELMKVRYKEFWQTNNLKLNEDEKRIIELIISVHKNYSLANSFYSFEKIEKLKIYLDKTENIKITHDLFNEDWRYKDSFILLDPPYLAGTELKKVGKKGYNYSGLWTEADDERLIKFIKANLKNNNVFLIFGSLENNLSKLIQKNFKNAAINVKKYKKSIFGISKERAEWYCVIKQN